MSTIVPIKGIRYNPEKVSDLSDVVTPPYDVIDAAAQQRYYDKHPYNIIRLEYGKTYSEDDDVNNRYSRASADYKTWLENKVLQPDSKPALYLYEQEYTVDGSRKVRSGYICGIKIEPYEKGVVLPHEETLPKHKADRLSLMKACRANFSPIFSLYSDPEHLVTHSLKKAAAGLPKSAFTDENGDSHRLWAITDPVTIEQVQGLMADKRIFIADGHHRYETAMNYKLEREKEGPGSQKDDPSYNYVMMTLVNLYDPGLVVLPTHRLVKNVDPIIINGLMENMGHNFLLEEFEPEKEIKSIKKFLSDLYDKGRELSGKSLHRHIFGVYINKKLFFASLRKEEDLPSLMRPDKSPEWRGLDVSVLHSLIMEKYLGIDKNLLARGEHITYTREEEGALEAVDRGEYQIAFFLNPTLVEEVTSVAANGEKMPQKSTFFYPKLITGLVIKDLT
ncbi:MAG: hypothetical protein JL50_16385 [Peptococcaceae bacterium BICA1-7]|nr:MAG: hypothetical protein JL50_16385 [Peptococcaceae bacterium BICA1-7]HBV96630.1 DUF1015 domain-containing protein [Desulfotomaculum sp.]